MASMQVLVFVPAKIAIVRGLRVLCLGLIGVAVACSSAATVPTATLHNAPNVVSDVSQVVDLMKGQCPSHARRVRLDFVQGDAHLRHVFDCSIVRGNAAAAQTAVLDLVANRENATQRAERTQTLQRQLGVPVITRADLVWGLGTGISGFSCTRAGDVAFHRQELDEAARSDAPISALRWTQVEAALVAGVCPNQLQLLFSSVAAAGQPAAARAVRTQLRALGVPS